MTVVALSALVALSLLGGASTSQRPAHRIPCPGLAATRCASILASDLCDGLPDCPGAVDELNCTACSTSTAAFLCRKDHRCIRSEYLCDTTRDCSDGEDERDCRADKKVVIYGVELTFPRGAFHCPGDKRGRWQAVLCDGVLDCKDEEDEIGGCGPNRNSAMDAFPICHHGALKCNTSRPDKPCLPAKKVCDGWVDCLNGEDEKNCGTTTTSTSSTATTPSTTSSSSTTTTPSTTTTTNTATAPPRSSSTISAGGGTASIPAPTASKDPDLHTISAAALIYLGIVLAAILALTVAMFITRTKLCRFRQGISIRLFSHSNNGLQSRSETVAVYHQ